MPARIKLTIFLVAASCIAAVSAVAWLSSMISTWCPWMVLAASLLSALWAVFVYYPKFDPTMNTFWRGPRDKPSVALTFDDGPSPHTAAILDTLKSRGVKATFFFLAANAERHPELVKRARAEGHAIGNHGSTHRKMHRLSAAEIRKEILGGESALGEISRMGGKKLLRVPHGFKSLSLVRTLKKLDYVLAAWTSGVWDSDRPGVEVVVQRAKRAVGPGCILLLHDGDGVVSEPDRLQTVQALPRIIDDCLSTGYKFVTMPQLFETSEVN